MLISTHLLMAGLCRLIRLRDPQSHKKDQGEIIMESFSVPILAVLVLIVFPTLVAVLLNKKLRSNPWVDIIIVIAAMTLYVLNIFESRTPAGNGYDVVLAYMWLFNAVLHAIWIPIDIMRTKNNH